MEWFELAGGIAALLGIVGVLFAVVRWSLHHRAVIARVWGALVRRLRRRRADPQQDSDRKEPDDGPVVETTSPTASPVEKGTAPIHQAQPSQLDAKVYQSLANALKLKLNEPNLTRTQVAMLRLAARSHFDIDPLFASIELRIPEVKAEIELRRLADRFGYLYRTGYGHGYKLSQRGKEFLVDQGLLG